MVMLRQYDLDGIEKKVEIELLFNYFKIEDDSTKLRLNFKYDIGSGLKEPFDKEFSEEEIKFANGIYKKTMGCFEKYVFSSDIITNERIIIGGNNIRGIYNNINEELTRYAISYVICNLANYIDVPLVLKSEFNDDYYLVLKTKTDAEMRKSSLAISDFIENESRKCDYWKRNGESKEDNKVKIYN